MRKFIGLSMSIALALTALVTVPVAASSDNSRNNIGDTETPGYLSFTSAADVFTFEVTIPDGSDGDARNGRLTVDTQDCCGFEDFWGVRIIKHNGKVMAEAVGDGSGVGNFSPTPDPGDWSGAATILALPRKSVTVEVYYDHGSGVFAADMFVRFQFTGENIVVTPVP